MIITDGSSKARMTLLPDTPDTAHADLARRLREREFLFQGDPITLTRVEMQLFLALLREAADALAQGS